FFLPSYAHLRHLPSFPTRRSSDLRTTVATRLAAWRPLDAYEGGRTHCSTLPASRAANGGTGLSSPPVDRVRARPAPARSTGGDRSEEHTSELQSQSNLVCRLLLEK